MQDNSRSKTFLKLLTEVLLIGLGVFLAVIAGQWKDASEHRATANATLRYFRADILANQTGHRKRTVRTTKHWPRKSHSFWPHQLHAPPKPLTKRFTFGGCIRSRWSTRPGNWRWQTRRSQTLLHTLPMPFLVFTPGNRHSKTWRTASCSQRLPQATFADQDPTGFVTAVSVYLADINIQETGIARSVRGIAQRN